MMGHVDDLRRLKAGNEALAAQLVDVASRLESYKLAIERSNSQRYDALRLEIDTMRLLTRFNRSTHFMVLGYITFTVATIYSLSVRYDGVLWAVVFPLTSHSGGPWWLELALRVVGVVAQLAWIGRLYMKAQVPSWLENRVTLLALTEEDYLLKWPLASESSPASDRTDP